MGSYSSRFVNGIKLPAPGPVSSNPVVTAANNAYNAGGRHNMMDYLRQFGISMSDQLTDFNSNYYQQYRKLMGKMTPTMGTDQVLAGLSAGGFGGSFAQRIVKQRMGDYEAKRNDFLNNATQSFALQGQRDAFNWNQSVGNMELGERQWQTQQDMMEAQTQFNPAQFVGGLVSTVTGSVLGNPGAYFGGGDKPVEPNNNLQQYPLMYQYP